MTRAILPTDFFQVERERDISNIDVELLTDLYLPIIGPNGLALYLKLFRYKENRARSHGQLLEALGISSGNFVSARKKLEGIGLMETRLLNDTEQVQRYLYVLKSPVSGRTFLTTKILRDQLIKASSEEVVSWLDTVYKLTNFKYVEGGQDITENFSEVYQTDEILDLKSAISKRRSSKRAIKTYFNIEKMLSFMHSFNSIFTVDYFSREELIKVEQLAASYKYTEEAIADILESSIDFTAQKGKRINFDTFKNELIADQGMSYLQVSESDLNKDKVVIKGDSDAAKLMREMERLSAEEFLIKKQGGGRLSPSDIGLIEHLREMNLINPVINALLDYVLEIKDGSLPTAYITKIAGSLARKQFDNAIDAYNYLHKEPKTSKKPQATKPVETPKENVVKENKVEDEDVLDMFED